jgi:HEAT repeat protein
MERNRNKAYLLAAFLLIVSSAWLRAQDAKVGQLLDQLKSLNPGVRAKAAMSLGGLGGAAKVAVPALGTALADRNLNVRYWAANALKRIGPEAKGAIPALVAALKTFPGGSPGLEGPARYYADVRSVAAEALGAIGPAAKEAIPALKEATGDENADVRTAAAEALKKIGAK